MNDRLTEDQQVELLKKIWKEYGPSVIIGLILAIVITVGWRFYQQYRIHRGEAASLVYEKMMVAEGSHQTAGVEAEGKLLKDRYARTPYASFASLMLAILAVQDNHFDQAEEHLTWVLHHSSNAYLRQIARMRLARLQLDQNHPDAALKLLETVDQTAYLGAILEIRGDCYHQQGKVAEAKQCYEEAIKLLPSDSIQMPFLQAKLIHELK